MNTDKKFCLHIGSVTLTGGTSSLVLKTDGRSRIFGDKVGDVTMPRTYSHILNHQSTHPDVVGICPALNFYYKLLLRIHQFIDISQNG